MFVLAFTKKAKLLIIVALLVLTSLTIFVPSSSINAQPPGVGGPGGATGPGNPSSPGEEDENNEAEEACAGQEEANKSICQNGFAAGKTGQTSKETCTGTGSALAACLEGFRAAGGDEGSFTCGFDDPATEDVESVNVKFDFGCANDPSITSPIVDIFLTIVRFLSFGVGIVVIAAIIVAGIRYASAEGNPETTAQAKNNIQMALTGLFIYLFIFALVQYLVPGGVFN